MNFLVRFAEFLASMWVIVGSVWLLYRGVVYVIANLTEYGMPKDQKNFSNALAWTIVVGEITFLGAVIAYLLGRIAP